MLAIVHSHLSTLERRFQNLKVCSHLAMEVAYGSVYIVDVGLFKKERKERAVSGAGVAVWVASTLATSSSSAVAAIVAEELCWTPGSSIVTSRYIAIVADILASSVPYSTTRGTANSC